MSRCAKNQKCILIHLHIPQYEQITDYDEVFVDDDDGYPTNGGIMYEELDSFERALQHFGTRVEVIAAMEMGGRISAEDAYQMIKTEVKELKKVRKSWKKENE